MIKMKVSSRPVPKEIKGDSLNSIKFNSVESLSSYVLDQLNFSLSVNQVNKLKTVLETALEFVMGDNMVLREKI